MKRVDSVGQREIRQEEEKIIRACAVHDAHCDLGPLWSL